MKIRNAMIHLPGPPNPRTGTLQFASAGRLNPPQTPREQHKNCQTQPTQNQQVPEISDVIFTESDTPACQLPRSTVQVPMRNFGYAANVGRSGVFSHGLCHLCPQS